MKAGTQITFNDLKLDKDIKTHNSSEILASIHKMKEVIEEEEKTEETVENQ